MVREETMADPTRGGVGIGGWGLGGGGGHAAQIADAVINL